ncbi:MAG: 50S ribosomal protein L4 [Azospirillum sp.]|nr:50S ribosomal protein L4 [Azospirillum sp.]MCZ8122908.1 50S ribosomal protein L4 [Magnetospirillum sp.]
MKIAVKNLDNGAAGEIDLADDVFGLEPRQDILARMVRYQLAKRRAGTHDTKEIGEVSGGGKKPWSQKGSGRARQGSTRSPQWRHGAVIFGPTPRSHAHELPKKVRKLALKTALSTKAKEGKLIVLDSAKLPAAKTKDLSAKFAKMGISAALFVDGATLDDNFAKAARNIPHIDVLPVQGANVYDILRRDTLVLTRDAVAALQERLK